MSTGVSTPLCAIGTLLGNIYTAWISDCLFDRMGFLRTILGQFTTNVAVPSASVSMYQVALGWRYFYNLSPIVTSIRDSITDSPVNQFTKIIKDGQLFILRDGKTYNAQGGEL